MFIDTFLVCTTQFWVSNTADLVSSAHAAVEVVAVWSSKIMTVKVWLSNRTWASEQKLVLQFEDLHLFSLCLNFRGLSLVRCHQLIEVSYFLLVFFHLLSAFYEFHFFLLGSHLIMVNGLFHVFAEGFELIVFLVENSDATFENVVLSNHHFGVVLIFARFLQQSVHIHESFIVVDIEFLIDEIVCSTPIIDVLFQIVFQWCEESILGYLQFSL